MMLDVAALPATNSVLDWGLGLTRPLQDIYLVVFKPFLCSFRDRPMSLSCWKISLLSRISLAATTPNTKQITNADLSFCNHFTWTFCNCFIRHLTLDGISWNILTFWRHWNILHFMHPTKVLLHHQGIMHLEASGMVSIWGKWSFLFSVAMIFFFKGNQRTT